MPRCVTCDEHYPMKRAELGYSTCTTCGEQEAKALRARWTVAPIAHKQGATIVTDKSQLKQINKTVPL
jgi:hypothetical protein